MVRTGEVSLLNLVMTGGAVSSGSWRTTVATRSRTSWAAVSMSRSRLKVAMTIELPADGDRAQLLDALDRVDRLLDALRDLGLDLLGRGAGQGGAHR